MDDRWITDWPASTRFPHYPRANAGEVLADPVSPLGWTFGWDGGIVPGYRAGLIRCGVYELADFDPDHPESVACFGGYLYINLSAIRMQGARNPAATVEMLDTAFFGDHPDVPPYIAHPDDQKPHLLPAIEAHTNWVLSCEGWPELGEDKADAAALRASRGDLRTRTPEELVARARSVQARLPHLFSQYVVSGTSAAVAPGVLGVVGASLDDPGFPMTLLSSLGSVDSADASFALWDLSRLVRHDPSLTAAFDAGVSNVLSRVESPEFLRAWASFIEDFGSRGPDEWDIGSPSWETHPELALAALDRVRLQSDDQSPRLRNQRGTDARDAAIARGVARVVLDAGDPGDLQPGDVLIAPNTDPSWTPLFMSASAVVVDVGSPLSHAVIVSRELGLPCVVSAKDATTRIPDGSVVEVGRVHRNSPHHLYRSNIISTGATP